MLYTGSFLLSAAPAHETIVRQYRTFFVRVHHGRLCAVRAVRFSPARRPGALLSDYCRFSVVSGWTLLRPGQSGLDSGSVTP